jgi:hypothetical protein
VVAVFTEGDGSFVPRLIRESGHHPEIADLLHTVIHTRRLRLPPHSPGDAYSLLPGMDRRSEAVARAASRTRRGPVG